MTTVESERSVAVPEQGNLVRVRDRHWVVESVNASSLPPDPLSSTGSVQHHRVNLVPIDHKGGPEALAVFWETEPGTEIRPQAELPDPSEGLDEAATFGAFLDAVRWGAIASAGPSAFQSPFRAGIDIEDYQLLPLVEALRMPRVSLLIADDVGLGKTVETGLIAQELVLRNQAQKIGALTLAAPADAPTAVTASQGDGTSTVTWAAPALNGGALVHYEVTASGDAGTQAVIDPAATFTGLQNGTDHSFSVHAVTEANGQTLAGAVGSATARPGRPPALSAMSATASGTTVTWGFGVSDDVIGDAVCTVNASGNPVRAETACGSMLSGSFNGAYSTAYTVTARCPDGARHVRRAGEGRPPACRHCARRPACMAGCWIVDGPSRVRPTRGPPPGSTGWVQASASVSRQS